MDLYSEQKRQSFKRSLTGGLFEKAKERIDDNITLINSNIKEMEAYYIKMGSKKDNKKFLEQADYIIITTGEIFKETYTLLKDYADFKFTNRQERTENLRVVKRYENNIANIKEKYDTITNKIKNQDLAMIETSRNSIRSSIIQSQRSGKFVNSPREKLQFELVQNEYIEQDIIARESQIKKIKTVSDQLHNLSSQTASMINKQGEMINTIEGNIGKTIVNITKATKEIKQADTYNEKSGDSVNKGLYVVIAIVVVLLILAVLTSK